MTNESLIQKLESLDGSHEELGGIEKAIKIVREHSLDRDSLTSALYKIVNENHQNTDSYTADRLADYLMGEPAGSGDTHREPLDSATPTQTLIQCIAECRDVLAGVIPYIDGSGFSTIYALKNANEQVERCQMVINAHEAQQREIPVVKREAYDGDWLNDTTHENGNYANKCSICGEIFNGHKRRVICRWCADKKSSKAKLDQSQPVRESVEGELVAMDFESESPEITFAVSKDSRWFAGKYAITQI